MFDYKWPRETPSSSSVGCISFPKLCSTIAVLSLAMLLSLREQQACVNPPHCAKADGGGSRYVLKHPTSTDQMFLVACLVRIFVYAAAIPKTGIQFYLQTNLNQAKFAVAVQTWKVN